jgi:hypothetical protein
MDKNIFEEGPRRGHAAGDTSLEQQASQLASDIKYKARQKMKGKSGSNLSPGQVQQLYRQLLNSSPAPGGVKAIVKKKLFGEQIDPGIVPVTEHLESSRSVVFSKIFEGADAEGRFVVRVTDKATGNTTYRKADRAKIAELRANKNIASVEITGRKEVDDAYKGDPKPNYGGKKAKKDYDGDGKVESGSKEHAGVVHNAIQRKKGGVADGKDTRKEEYIGEAPYQVMGSPDGKKEKKIGKPVKSRKYADARAAELADTHKATGGQYRSKYVEEVIYEKEDKGGKKLDVMKGKNAVKINPTIGESIRAELDALKAQRVEEAASAAAKAGPTPEERKKLQAKDQMLKKKIMLQKQTMQMQKQGRLPLNYSESCDNCEKCGKSPCECPKKEGEAKAMDPREVPTRINLAKNKLRAMGLKMSYDMEGEVVEEGLGKRMAAAGAAGAIALGAGGMMGKKVEKDVKQVKSGGVTRVNTLADKVSKRNEMLKKISQMQSFKPEGEMTEARKPEVEAQGKKIAGYEREGRAAALVSKFRKENPGSRQAPKVPGAKETEGDAANRRRGAQARRAAKHGLTSKERKESQARAKYDSPRD